MPKYDDFPEKDPYLLLHHKVKSSSEVPAERHLAIITFDTVRTNSGYPDDQGSNDHVSYYHAFKVEDRRLWEICIKQLALPDNTQWSYKKNDFVFFECPGKGTLDIQVKVKIGA